MKLKHLTALVILAALLVGCDLPTSKYKYVLYCGSVCDVTRIECDSVFFETPTKAIVWVDGQKNVVIDSKRLRLSTNVRYEEPKH